MKNPGVENILKGICMRKKYKEMNLKMNSYLKREKNSNS